MNRADRRRRERDQRRLASALKARGLHRTYTVLPLNDPASEQRAAAIIADLERTLADPDLDPLVRKQLEGERQAARAAQLLCASCDPTKPEPELCH